MSGPSPGRTLRPKTSELYLFRTGHRAPSLAHDAHLQTPSQNAPPVPELPVPEQKSRRKLVIFGKRRKSGSTVSTSPSSSNPSYDNSDQKKSRETTQFRRKTTQGLANRPTGAVYHVQPSETVLPPLDVSPPSLGFSTSESLISSLQVRTLSGNSGQGTDIRTNNRSPIKGQQRPIITVSAPAFRSDIEMDGDVFVSPRSAPSPPIRNVDCDFDKSKLDSSARVPTSPLRFPIPPAEQIPTAASFPEESLLRKHQFEFNSEFSFPSKITSTPVRQRHGGRDVNVKLQDQNSSHSNDSSYIFEKHVSETEPVPQSPKNKNSCKPPTSPLPLPPAFCIDSKDQVEQFTSLPSVGTIPSLHPGISRPTRSSSRSKTVLQSTTSDSTKRISSFLDREQEKAGVGKTKEVHERKQSGAALKDQSLLRAEMSEQSAQLDELSRKVASIISRTELERAGMCRQIDALETETRHMKQEIRRLTTIVMDGYESVKESTIGGFIETPPSTMEAIGDILMTPSDIESPLSPFQQARRLLSTKLKQDKVLRRTNTMPDGFEGLRAGSQTMSSGKKSNRSSSPWMMASSGLLPKFAPGSRHGTPERGLGLEFAFPDSPVVKESLNNSIPDTQVSSSSYSSSVPTSSSSTKSLTRPAIAQFPSATSLTERFLGFRNRGRGEKSPPNMEEILAKLRSFESHSPAFR